MNGAPIALAAPIGQIGVMSPATQSYEKGFAAHRQGDLDLAAQHYDAALALDARHAKALQMRGVVHLQQREHEKAVELIRRAIAADPTDAGAHGNLTSALLALNRADEAIEAARRGVELNPEAPEIWGNLGTALNRRRRYPEALQAFERAVALQPERAGLHSAIGHCLGKLERFEEALASHRRAMALAPERPEYRNNMSVTLRAMNLDGEAEELLQSAIVGGLDDPDLKASLGILLQKRGKTREAVAALEQASVQNGRSHVDAMLMFLKNYVDENSIEAQLQQAVRAGEEVAARVTPYTSHANSPDPVRIIRVGFVSSDFKQHSVGLFLIDVLRELSAGDLVLYAYSGHDSDDPFNRAFRAMVPNWHSTGNWSDEMLARQIRSDGIDILLDLTGPTGGARMAVFAMKPAPLAVGWLGYSGTTGLKAVDYVLGDAEVLPEGVEQLVETAWRLPDSYVCFSPQPGAPPVGPLPALQNGFVTFGSFNNTNKISTATFETWARILEAVPDSRLHLKARSSDNTDDNKHRLVEEFTAHGIAAERITVLDWVKGWLGHLPLYGAFDIALDPFPYNGTTTTCQALHMGVPVLALRGDRFVSRVSASILHTAGLDDWIAESVDDYVAKAVAFASDLPALANLRETVRPRFTASAMCDAPRFAHNFEAALRGMWRRWCAEQG
jgi:protein O-GlcNAc transferase